MGVWPLRASNLGSPRGWHDVDAAPSFVEVKASEVLSGENEGSVSSSAVCVMRQDASGTCCTYRSRLSWHPDRRIGDQFAVSGNGWRRCHASIPGNACKRQRRLSDNLASESICCNDHNAHSPAAIQGNSRRKPFRLEAALRFVESDFQSRPLHPYVAQRRLASFSGANAKAAGLWRTRSQSDSLLEQRRGCPKPCRLQTALAGKHFV